MFLHGEEMEVKNRVIFFPPVDPKSGIKERYLYYGESDLMRS